jgi:hypothetical protein
MVSIEFRYRLIPELAPELEWLYLINETYVGEVCIIPLLQDLLGAPIAEPAFRHMIERQIGEEEEHVARYLALLRNRPYPGSGYDVEFTAYVRALPSTTLKVFALQALLEGVSLGALRYRMDALERSPSGVLDPRIYEDELRHTRFAHGFVKHLIAADGLVPRRDFEYVAREVNAIFARHFCGVRLSMLTLEAYGARGSTAEAIDASEGMRKFTWKSAGAIVECKNQFLRRYDATRAAF